MYLGVFPLYFTWKKGHPRRLQIFAVFAQNDGRWRHWRVGLSSFGRFFLRIFSETAETCQMMLDKALKASCRYLLLLLIYRESPGCGGEGVCICSSTAERCLTDLCCCLNDVGYDCWYILMYSDQTQSHKLYTWSCLSRHPPLWSLSDRVRCPHYRKVGPPQISVIGWGSRREGGDGGAGRDEACGRYLI